MKGKGIFAIIFALLMLLGSYLVVDNYDEVRNNNLKSYKLDYNVADDILEFAYNGVIKDDKDYKILEFKEDINQELASEIELRYRRSPVNYYSYLADDPNFAYCLISVNTNNKLCKDEKNILNDDNHIYGELFFEEMGVRQNKGNIDNYLIHDMNEYHRKNNYDLIDMLDEYDIDIDDVKVNSPSGYKFIYSIDKEYNEESQISHMQFNRDDYYDFTIGAMGFSAILVALFILIYPIKYEKEVHPFKMAIKIKFEILVIILGLLFLSICFLMAEVISMSISGLLINFIHETGIYDGATLMVNIFNILIWMTWFILVAVGVFYIKYFFIRGFKTFVIKDTLVGAIYLWFKDKFNHLALVDFSDKTIRNIIIFMILNLVILSVISLLILGFGILGFIFLFVYIVLLTIWILKQYSLISDDYQSLLASTKKVASGNFEDIMNEDVGIFKSMQLELNNIKDGFSKAVKEETISQSMKTELITNVSHDLKTPLTGIRNYVELLNDDSLNEDKRKEYLNLLDGYTDRLGNLIEDLFEVSKVNSGNIELELIDLDIISLIKQALAEKDDEFTKNNLEVVMDFEDKIEVTLDSDKTYRVFDNLLNNISKYAMPNTRVYIDVLKSEDDVEIIFKNVSKVRMNFNSQEITERFVRGDKSRSEAGSGIGLAIVQSFLEAQGAKFKIDIDGDLFKAIINFKLSKQAA